MHMPSFLQRSQPWRQLLVLLLAAAMLSACGFHLRGPANLPFKTIYLGSFATTPLGTDLKRYLRASGVTIVDDQKEADAQFMVLSDIRERKILTLNTNGQVREYVISLRFRFQVKDNKGAILVAPAEIYLKRDISYDANQELAKQAEEVLLYRDMQGDLVQQILRRMSASKAAADDSVKD